MNAIVSMLWDLHAGVLEPHLGGNPAVLYTRPGYAGTNEPARSRLAQRNISVVPLPSLLTPPVVAGLRAQAATRARRIAEDVTEEAVAAAYGDLGYEPRAIRAALTAQLATRIYDVLATVESLVLAAERSRVELLVVSNDTERAERAAISWAKAAGVKTLHVVHASGSTRPNPQGRYFHADLMAIAAEKSMYVYESLPIGRDRFVLTGWPKYDAVKALIDRRDAIRSEFRNAHGLAPADRLVMFATTWFSGFGALERKTIYEDSARSVFAAVRFVHSRLPGVRLVIKDRPNNAHQRGALDAIAAAEGFSPGSWLWVDGDPLPFLAAVDVVICVDSSIATEAAAFGTPVINLWSPASWIVGPMFSGDDGIAEVPPERLGETLLRVLEQLTEAQTAIVSGRLRSEGILVDGRSVERLSALMDQLRGQASPAPRVQSARTAERCDVGDCRRATIGLIETANCVLDVRCGDGHRTQLLRARLPMTKLIGLDPDPVNVSLASAYLDVARVGGGSADDLDGLGLDPTSVDVVLLFDVLCRLPDPWAALLSLRRYLASSARLYASFPNARTPDAIVALCEGHDPAGPGGAYAYDMVYRFSLESAVALFNRCGYTIERAEGIADPFSDVPAPPYAASTNLDFGRVILKEARPQDIAELRIHEFVLVARPLG